MGDSEKRGGTCLRIALWGLGITLFLILLVTVLIVENWERIKETDFIQGFSKAYDQGKIAMDQLRQLQGELQKKFPADHIQVNIRTTQGFSNKEMAVEFINPVFLQDQLIDVEGKAREIALFLVAHFDSLKSFNTLYIQFIKRSGSGVTSSKGTRFPFEVMDLLKEKLPEKDVSSKEENEEFPSSR